MEESGNQRGPFDQKEAVVDRVSAFRKGKARDAHNSSFYFLLTFMRFYFSPELVNLMLSQRLVLNAFARADGASQGMVNVIV